jgi:hypothetical protein
MGEMTWVRTDPDQPAQLYLRPAGVDVWRHYKHPSLMHLRSRDHRNQGRVISEGFATLQSLLMAGWVLRQDVDAQPRVA